MFHFALDRELHLRMVRENDAPELFRLVDANRAHLRQWLPWVDDNISADQSLLFIRSSLQQHAENEGFSCAIVLAQRIVGVVGYQPINQANRCVDLGYWLGREVLGRGIMTRCCRVLIDHAFAKLGLNRIAIRVATGNTASRAIPERLGFMQEGVLREAEWLYDHFVDHAIYGLLKRDWKLVRGCPGQAGDGR
jgi:ribosomal-protein-serine acetyltransferase